MYTLFFDTDCDITPEVANRYGAKLISMPYIVDGDEIFPYVDFEKFDEKAFYGMLRNGVLPTTCAISEEEYRRYFEPELEAGKDILYVHFSRAMTITFDNADKVIASLLEKYPGRRIELIDAKGITIIGYNISVQIGELVKQGKTIDEIKEWAATNVDKTAVYFYADNLKFFARSGRVSGFSAFMGGMIGIKPIIYMSSEGKMVSIGKAVGKKKAMEKLLNYVIDLQEDIKDYPVIIGHCDAMNLVNELSDMLKKQFGDDLKIEVVNVNPTAGSHCGPDTLGVTFHAKHR